MQGTLAAGTASSVVSATVFFGLPVGTDIALLGEDDAVVDASTGTVSGSWNLSVLTVSQAALQDYAYFGVHQDKAGNYDLTVPLGYYETPTSAMQVAWLDVYLDPSFNELSRTLVVEDPGGAVGAITPPPGSQLVALVRILSQTTGTIDWATVSGTVFDATQPLSLGTSSVSPATDVYLELDVTDVTNQTDWVSWTGTTP